MKQFTTYLKEERIDSYRMVILSHDHPDDPNVTGEKIKKAASELNVECYLFELDGGYLLDGRAYNKDDKNGFKIDPENTLILARGSVTERNGWIDLVTQFERAGYCVINSRHCLEVCHDKYRTSMFLSDADVRQPNSVLVADKESVNSALERLDSEFPIILKTITGTHGIGVMFIESIKALQPTAQILYKLDEDIGIILQEYIKTTKDVRAHVLDGKVIATLKRPVVEGDFRSNISQGSKPESYKLSKLEEKACLSAAKAVDGIWVGVDFIPSANPKTESPYVIEVNSSPGTGGVDKINGIDIIKTIINHFKIKEKWIRPKPFKSIY